MRGLYVFVLTLCLCGLSCLWCVNAIAKTKAPLYKPSSRAAEPLDISINAYGGSLLAPDALNIGETAPDFELPIVGGGSYQLSEAAASGPVVVIFYRGHW